MIRFGVVFFLLLIVSTPVLGTQQIPDLIMYEGQSYPLFTTPLESVMDSDRNARLAKKLQKTPCSVSLRGYQAFWKVEEGKLWLAHVIVSPCSGAKELRLSKLFGWGAKSPYLAEWFLGTLVIPTGKPSDTMRGFQREYERYQLLVIERGEVVGSEAISGEEYRSRRERREL